MILWAYMAFEVETVAIPDLIVKLDQILFSPNMGTQFC